MNEGQGPWWDPRVPVRVSSAGRSSVGVVLTYTHVMVSSTRSISGGLSQNPKFPCLFLPCPHQVPGQETLLAPRSLLRPEW